MYKNKRILAIVSARKGSKRLPRKNILELNGKPLVAWTFEAAKKSKYIDDILISTDDHEIIKIANDYGINVPFLRPEALSTDSASSIEVVLHGIQFLERQNKIYNYIVLLQPTSPLRSSFHIDEAIELLFIKNANAIISVCAVDHSPLWMNTLPQNGSLDSFLKENVKNKRSQDLAQYFRVNGAIYLADINILKQEKSFFLNRHIFAYIMDKKSSIDIDDQHDFMMATILSDKG